MLVTPLWSSSKLLLHLLNHADLQYGDLNLNYPAKMQDVLKFYETTSSEFSISQTNRRRIEVRERSCLDPAQPFRNLPLS